MGNKIYTEEELRKENQPVYKTTVNGVDPTVTDKAFNSSFTASQSQKDAQSKTDTAVNRVEAATSKDKIVSDSTYEKLNQSFTVPSAVKEADIFLKNQLQKIQSGKTSYTDQVKDMMSQIQNREKFSYDVDADPLFGQALASAMNSGKSAMQDTIGQASALTGGYGSTYATSAGNQAYNAFIEDAYDNLPQYYQMAMEAYQMEGDEMYRQLGMLTDADDREYNRNLTAYDATYQHRNQLYNESYNEFRDSKTDALNSANLQLSEHGQLVSDAVNYYNTSSDYSDTLYEREYNKWADEVNQAMKWADMLNSDWWKQTQFDEGVRQYEQSFAEEQRQFDKNYAQKDEHFYKGLEHESSENQKDREHDIFMQDDAQAWSSSENALNREHENADREDRQAWDDANREDTQAWNSAENSKELGYKYSALGEDKRQFNITHGDVNGDGVLSAEELYSWNESQKKSESGDGYVTRTDENTGKTTTYKNPTETMYKKALDAYNKGGMSGLNQYLNTVPSEYDTEGILEYMTDYDFRDRTYTVIDSSKNIVVDNYGYKFNLNEVPEDVKEMILYAGLKTKK